MNDDPSGSIGDGEQSLPKHIQAALSVRREPSPLLKALASAGRKGLVFDESSPVSTEAEDQALLQELIGHEDYVDYLRAKAETAADRQPGPVRCVGHEKSLDDGPAPGASGPDGDAGAADG